MTDPISDSAARILRLLYEFARNPFNDGTLSFGLSGICHATRLDIEVARKIANDLVHEGLAEQTHTHPEKFRITLQGMQVAARPLKSIARNAR